MASLSTRFMNGSNPHRVPSTYTGKDKHRDNDYYICHKNKCNGWCMISYLTAAIDPQMDPLVHELLQLWGMSLGHGANFGFRF